MEPVTAELRSWILGQSAAGHAPAALVEGMLASGWSEAAAVLALQTTLPGVALPAAQAAAPVSVRVPEPLASQGGAAVVAAGHAVTVLASLRNPRVAIFGGLMTAGECDEMIGLARARLARSETVQTQTGSGEVNAARTSDGMFFRRGEFPLCARLEERFAALLGWPVENGEGLQVLRYRPGAEYKPHFDYFDPSEPGTPALLQRGGQRVASLICYLNTPARGGATVFPEVGLEVAPVKGNAVFFSYDRASPATLTLHGGEPVLEGEKWVATQWVRERRFD